MSSPLFFSNEMLRAYGCLNCIWKELGDCPLSLSGSESSPDGYCSKLTDFLHTLSIGDDSPSVSSVKEKFHLYIQEIQSLSDYRDYLRCKREYDSLLSSGSSPRDLLSLEIRLNNYRLWWNRLSDSVTKGLSRVSDREKKSQVQSSDARLTVQALNSLLRDSRKQLSESSGSVTEKDIVGDSDVDGS